jgi:hypothetical protein
MSRTLIYWICNGAGTACSNGGEITGVQRLSMHGARARRGEVVFQVEHVAFVRIVSTC